MKIFTVSPELQSALEKMSRDMAVSVEGLVNQAVFNWAKLHGYVEPGQQPKELEEPQTSRVPVVDDVEDWRLASGGSFSAPELTPVAPDSTAPSVAKQQRLVLVLAEREVVIEGARFLVGRDVSCDLTIDSPRISRQHAVLHVLEQRVEVEDLGSSNGTWYQDQRIDKRTLVHGDEVLFGDTSVRIEFR